jgi:glycosyltransferase involved in cell wall biosynthesis
MTPTHIEPISQVSRVAPAPMPARPRVTMVVSALPPVLDGIGDYTARLAGTLVENELAVDVTLLTDGTRRIDPIPGISVHGDFDPVRPGSNWGLLDLIAADRPDWLIVQYNPFSYGRRGLNLTLPRVLRRVRSRVPGVRLAVMYHERYVPVMSWQFAIMTVWQRWQYRRIGRAADVVFFSIQKWADEYRRFTARRGQPVHHLPVGSAMPRVPIDLATARARLGIADDEIVLGLFGSSHVSRDLVSTREAVMVLAARHRRIVLLYIGPHGVAIRKSIGSLPAAVRLIVDGPHPPEEVSRRLSAIDLYLAAYTDGVSTRRSAMIAAFQHGLCVLGTDGINTDPELRAAGGTALVLIKAGDEKAFAAEVARVAEDSVERRRLASAGLALYERRYAWSAIAAQMMSALASAPVH